jgi:WD40 repeat protein
VTTRFARRIPVLALALALTVAAGAEEPKKQPDPDALPKGAKLRLGDGRMVFRHAPSVVLLPPDYKAFVLPDGIATLHAYDLTTGRPLDPAKKTSPTFGGGGGVLISADGKRFVGMYTGAIAVREVATGQEVKQLKPPAGFRTASVYNAPVSSLSGDGKVMAQGGTGANNKGAVVVWDVEKGEVMFQTAVALDGPAIPVLSADGKLVAVRGAGYGGVPMKPEDDPRHSVWVYEVSGGKELSRARATPGGYLSIVAAAFSPDGSTLALSCGDGVIDLWDVKAGKAMPPLLGRSAQGKYVAFSPDGKSLAAVSEDGTIQRWAVADGKPLGTTPGPQSAMLVPKGVAFADNDRARAWGSVEYSPVVWEAPSGKVLTPLPEHIAAIKSIAFAAGGKEILTSGIDGRIARWDAATGKPLGPVKLRPSAALSAQGVRLIVNLTPDGTKAVYSGTPAAVFDLATGVEEFVVPRGQLANFSTSSVPSADLTKVIVLSVPSDTAKPAKCIVWDLVARKKLIEVEIPPSIGFPPSAAISPGGTRLVTTSRTRNNAQGEQTLTVTGWDLKTGKRLGQVEDVNARGLAFVAAASDAFAVVSSGGGRLRAYDYEIGRGGDEFHAADMRGESPAGPVVFSPDGKRFAASGPAEVANTYEVKVREWPTGKVLHTFTGFRALVTAMTFSPDGKTLATGSQDTTVVLWDVSEAK